MVANLLVFINAHLAGNHANQVAVIASHTTCARILYPTPQSPRSRGQAAAAANGVAIPIDVDGDVGMGNSTAANGRAANVEDANKYRPFRTIEQELLRNLTELIGSTTEAQLANQTTTMIAGALTTALAYIAKQMLLLSPNDPNVLLNTDTSAPGSTALPASTTDGSDAAAARARPPLTSRILVVSVSGDLAAQYIPVMNAIFAAQRQRVPIDVLKLAGDTVFLQQACDSTGGIYLDPTDSGTSASTPAAATDHGSAHNGDATANGGASRVDGSTSNAAAAVQGSLQGLLVHLLHPLLPDPWARHSLVPPADAAVDFRAACFCHRRVVDIGYVCSVCLSIFCEPLAGGVCLTCGSALAMPREAGLVPAVLPRAKRKKKKRAPGVAGVDTPGTSSAAGTPGPS